MTLKNIILGFISLAVVAWLAGCASGNGRKRQRQRPVLTVSIPPQMYFVKAIADTMVEVNCLMEASADPETFEPSINQMLNLQKSEAYLPMGTLQFEKSLIEKLRQNRRDMPIMSMSEDIETLTGTHDCGHHHHHDGDEEADPHVWSSVKNAKTIALNTLNALIAIDSVNEDTYRQNYGALMKNLDSMDRDFSQLFADEDVPHTFVVWHPSLSYFARDYGLKQLTIGTAGKESSVKGMQESIDRAGEEGAKIYFYQSEFDPGRAEAVGRSTGAEPVTINPMSGEWEQEMINLYVTFKNATKK